MAAIKTPKTKTMVIKAGETGVIPLTATIISVGISGNADAESNCASVNEAIANAEQYQCYEFVLETSTSLSWDETNVYVDSVEIGDTSYEIGQFISDIDQNPGVVGKIKQVVPESIMKMGENTKGQAWYSQLGDNNITEAICFKTLPSIAEKLRIKITNNAENGNEGPDLIYYIYPRTLSKTSVLVGGQPTWCTCVNSITT
jgi:hypothetical protein